MPRQLGRGGTQLPRHMGPPGPKMGGDPYACDTGIGPPCSIKHIDPFHRVSNDIH